MPKIIDMPTLVAVTAELAENRSKTDIAKRHNIGRQWLYDWEAKLEYHGIQGCADISEELILAIYSGDLHTPELTSEYSGRWYLNFRRIARGLYVPYAEDNYTKEAMQHAQETSAYMRGARDEGIE